MLQTLMFEIWSWVFWGMYGFAPAPLTIDAFMSVNTLTQTAMLLSHPQFNSKEPAMDAQPSQNSALLAQWQNCYRLPNLYLE